MAQNLQTDWHKNKKLLGFDSQLADYLSCNSQIPKSQTRKSQADIVGSLQFRLCVIVVWFMLIPKA